MWLLAEIAFRLSGRASKRAEASLADAKRFNAKAVRWSQWQAWADGVGPWPGLHLRNPQTGKG